MNATNLTNNRQCGSTTIQLLTSSRGIVVPANVFTIPLLRVLVGVERSRICLEIHKNVFVDKKLSRRELYAFCKAKTNIISSLLFLNLSTTLVYVGAAVALPSWTIMATHFFLDFAC